MDEDVPKSDYERAGEELGLALHELGEALKLTAPYRLLVWTVDHLERFLERVRA